MKTSRQTFFSLVLLLVIVSCSSSSQLSYKVDKNIYAGQLSDSTYSTLKLFLNRSTKTGLNDTIFIKYDYNIGNCWNSLDQQNHEYIMGFVTRGQARMKNLTESRINCSFYNYREPGNSFNKIKQLDNSIDIDSSRQLLGLLFNKRSACGNSIIILPDRRFLAIQNDPHSAAFNYEKQKIEVLLSKK